MGISNSTCEAIQSISTDKLSEDALISFGLTLNSINFLSSQLQNHE
jgi:hypothetical protein